MRFKPKVVKDWANLQSVEGQEQQGVSGAGPTVADGVARRRCIEHEMNMKMHGAVCGAQGRAEQSLVDQLCWSGPFVRLGS